MWELKQRRQGELAILAKTVLCLLLAVMSNAQVLVAGTDLHWLWDDRCAECHGHSGEFARRFLRAADGELSGPHRGKNLRNFMRHHYLQAGEVDAVYAMLLAQAQTQPRFQAECGGCHGSAAQLVRASMTLRLLSGQTVQHFLQGHRGLQTGDIEFYVSLLTRVAIETGKAADLPR
jgi:hypothetical protein